MLAHPPWPWRAVNALAAPFAGLMAGELNADALCARAVRKTGLEDFGGDSFRAPLRHVLQACENEAALNFIGRISAYRHTLMLLTTRLQLFAARSGDPRIAAQEVDRPIFITGLPRSGTTLLHRLIARNPATRTPLTWETMYPIAPESGPDDRIRRTERALRWLDRLAPGFRAIHSVAATNAQECIAITAYSFESPQFHTTYNLPSYETWLTGHDPKAAYDFHRMFLQHLQAEDMEGAPERATARRWVLKAPAHLFHLPRLMRTYPDARLIQCHRDPMKVIPSVASLTAVLRRAFSDRIDGKEIGAEVLNRWTEGVRRSMAIRDDPILPRARVFDLTYDRLVADPLAAVRDVYTHFGMELTREAETAMADWLARNPQNRFGRHRYTLEPFGLTEDAVREKFRDYCNFFDVRVEG